LGWPQGGGLRYFEEISRDRMSKPSDYRLLILDGHGSHMTMKFFEKCHQNRIVLAVFPPHSTHRLQPLDIGIVPAVRDGLLEDCLTPGATT